MYFTSYRFKTATDFLTLQPSQLKFNEKEHASEGICRKETRERTLHGDEE